MRLHFFFVRSYHVGKSVQKRAWTKVLGGLKGESGDSQERLTLRQAS